MGFKLPSDTDTEDFKERIEATLFRIEKFETLSLDQKIVPIKDSSKTLSGTPTSIRYKIELKFVAYSIAYPNPELKKEKRGG